jgi:hypothetical protein
MFKAPVFMFPTKIVLLDDDIFYAQLFADSIKKEIDIVPLTNTTAIFEQKDADFNFLEPPSDLDIDFKGKIKTSISQQNPPWDDLISVIIADQHMTPMLGSTLLSKLKSPYLRKILISNFIHLRPDEEIDYLRNKGIIQAVLDKTDNLFSRLSSFARQCQIEFFSNLSNDIYSNNANPLTDSEFASLFIRLIYEFQPDTIWPLSNLNSFIFAKTKQQSSLKIFISTKEEIEALLDSHRVETAPKSISSMLLSNEFTLAHEDPLTLDGKYWERYLRPARKLHGRYADYLFCTELEASYV